MKHKFKIGDRVQFKSWKELKDEFPENESGNIDMGDIYFLFKMKPLCNTYATIIGVRDKDKGEVELDEFSNEEFFKDNPDDNFLYLTSMLKQVKEEKKYISDLPLDEQIEYHERKLEELKAQKEKERWKFTENEKVILRNLPEEYKWIVRDNLSNRIYIFVEKPYKERDKWTSDTGFNYLELRPFQHIFQCIQWSDTEPCEFRKYI